MGRNLILPETLEIVIDRNVTMIGQLSLDTFIHNQILSDHSNNSFRTRTASSFCLEPRRHDTLIALQFKCVIGTAV